MNAYGYRPQAELLGIPDRFIGQGTQEQLRRICGFDLEGIYRTIMKSKK
jgi:1-deoxy-D-xylulose-5-phosphate synthase